MIPSLNSFTVNNSDEIAEGAANGSFEYMQIQEFDEACDELAAGTKNLEQMLKTVQHIRENNYFLHSSQFMRSKVLNTIHGFTGKLASTRLSVARARNRFVYLAKSPLAYLINDDMLTSTEAMLLETEENLIKMRSMIPELEKSYEGEVAAGELDPL